MREDVEQVAERLTQLYEMSFNGASRGKFQIRTATLRRLAGRQQLKRGFVKELTSALADRGYALVDLRKLEDETGRLLDFAVVKGRWVGGWRRAGVGKQWKVVVAEAVVEARSRT